MFSRFKGNKPPAYCQYTYTKPEEKHWLEYMIFFFVVLTAIGTLCAARYTRNQWLTAEDNEKRSLRAYVISNKTRAVNYGFKEPNGSLRWSLWSIVENIGNTPTRSLKIRGTVEHQGKTPFQVMNHYDWKTARTAGGRRSLIGPKDEIIGLGMGDIPGSALDQISQWDPMTGPHYRVEMAGVITYEDVFGENRWTEFCFAVHLPFADYEHYPAGQVIRSEPDLCPKHNCADDECKEE